jgi:NDP-sugar pyrophosphorylase family protein
MSITAVILCGGKGTRLQPVIGPDLPKCLAPVGERAFLTYVLDNLTDRRIVDKIVLCAGPYESAVRMALDRLLHHSGSVEVFGSSTFYAATPLSYSSGEQRGTLRALKDAMPQVVSSHVLLLNGDTYCPVQAAPLLREHVDFGWELTTVCTRNYGRYLGPEDVRYTGVSLYTTKSLLAALEEHECLGTVVETFHSHFKMRGTLNPKIVGWPFHDIGTPEGYAEAEGFLREQGVIK